MTGASHLVSTIQVQTSPCFYFIDGAVPASPVAVPALRTLIVRVATVPSFSSLTYLKSAGVMAAAAASLTATTQLVVLCGHLARADWKKSLVARMILLCFLSAVPSYATAALAQILAVAAVDS